MSKQQDDDANASMQQILADLWKRGLSLVRERVDLLQSAAAAAAGGTLTPSLQANALDIAHKLSGSLGMFGYPRGSQLAQQLEVEFTSARPDPAAVTAAITELDRMLFPKTDAIP
jgi:HPt (histidine-containing phosphotransfer) domain-containing protein